MFAACGLALAGCDIKIGEDFSVLEEKEFLIGSDNNENENKPIKILNGIPSESSFLMGNLTEIDFGLKLSKSSGKPSYFKAFLDGAEISEYKSDFFKFSGESLPEGTHTLDIVAYNNVSNAKFTFNLIRNSPPLIISSVPEVSLGQSLTINCTQTNEQFKVEFSDLESDEMTFEWSVNGVAVSEDDIFNKATSSIHLISFNCDDLGSKVLKLTYNDSFNEGEFNFYLNVIDPSETAAQPVEITSYSPSPNPVRMVDGQTETFVTNIKPGAGAEVTFKWYLDNVIVSNSPHDKNFIKISGSDLSVGDHDLQIAIENEINEESYTFELVKNSPPEVTTSAPPLAGTSISCTDGAQAFDVTATDADGDEMTFVWKFNGALNSPLFVTTSTVGTPPVAANAAFDPDCANSGSHIISVDINDGFETTTQTWAITVTNPLLATIDSYNPTGTPIRILSDQTVTFSFSASGKSPLVYSWDLDGTPVPGEVNNIYTINPGDLSPGSHTLTANVSDPDSSDSYTWNIIQNAAPTISNISPSVALRKLNANNTATFSLDGADANGDNISYTWTLNELSSPLIGTSVSGATAQAVFSPTTDILGSHVLKVSASDGYESVEYAWNLQVNLFSNFCNTLEAGEICTIAGPIGVGSHTSPTSDEVNLRPHYLANDGADNLFIGDTGSGKYFFTIAAIRL